MMNLKKAFVIVSLLALPMFAQASKSLNEQDVRELLQKTDMAVMQHNINLMAETASDNAIYVYHVRLDGASRSTRANKAEYLNSLRRGWSEYKNYEYSRNSAKITIESPQKATVSSKVTEFLTIDGQDLQAVTRETVTVEVVNGHPLITKVVGYVKVDYLTGT